MLPSDFADSIAARVSKTAYPIDRPQQRVIVGALAHRVLSPDGYFGRVLSSSGFGSALADVIAELKRSMIDPDTLLTAATAATHTLDDPGFLSKAQEVCQLYTAYEALLQEKSLRDEEDRISAAVAAANDPTVPVDDHTCVCLDGFHRLSALWRALLRALASRSVEVVVTLPWQPDRPLLFAAPSRTRDQLFEEFTVTEDAHPARLDGRPDVLVSLEQAIFDGKSAAPPPPADPNSLALWDTPNPYFEAEMIARALRREADQRGTPWNRMAVIVRTTGSADVALPAVCERYGVPITIAEGGPITDTACARRMLLLLQVIAGDWDRKTVVAFLNAALRPEHRLRADQIGRAAAQKALRVGRDGWQKLVDTMRPEGDPVADTLRTVLAWDAQVRAMTNTPGNLAERLKPLIESPLVKRGDHETARVLWNAVADYARATEAAGRGAISYASFARDLPAYLEGVRTPPHDAKDSVVILEAGDSRAREIDFAVVPELVERTFPKRVTEDPFFRDDERLALTQAGAELEPRGLRADEERLLFYQAITAPARRLVLCYPRSSEDADTLRSFYVDEAEDAVGSIPTVVRGLSDVVPDPDECVDQHDRLLAACAAIDAGASLPSGMDSEIAAEAEKCVEARNLPHFPRLAATDTRHAYTAPRALGVTEIETYAQCPMRHLLAYGIKLRPERDGAGPTDRGIVYHRALARWLRKVIDRRSIPDTEPLTAELVAEIEHCLAEHTVDAPVHRMSLMRRALLDAARSLGTREPAYRDQFGTLPRYAELSFGPQAAEHGEANADSEDSPDAASVSDTLDLQPADGRTVRLCGRIDRVDMMADGQTAVLIDYKLGSAPTNKATRDGSRIQAPVYCMALQKLWQLPVAAACYDSASAECRNRVCHRDRINKDQFATIPAVEGKVDVGTLTPGQVDEMVEAAKHTVFAAADGITEGCITPIPGDWCGMCPYTDVCRTTDLDGHDGEPAPSAEEAGRV